MTMYRMAKGVAWLIFGWALLPLAPIVLLAWLGRALFDRPAGRELCSIYSNEWECW